MQLRLHSAQSAVSGPPAAACSVTLQKVALTARASLSKADHGWPHIQAILLPSRWRVPQSAPISPPPPPSCRRRSSSLCDSWATGQAGRLRISCLVSEPGRPGRWLPAARGPPAGLRALLQQLLSFRDITDNCPCSAETYSSAGISLVFVQPIERHDLGILGVLVLFGFFD